MYPHIYIYIQIMCTHDKINTSVHIYEKDTDVQRRVKGAPTQPIWGGYREVRGYFILNFDLCL